jgi:hypothetical protein
MTIIGPTSKKKDWTLQTTAVGCIEQGTKRIAIKWGHQVSTQIRFYGINIGMTCWQKFLDWLSMGNMPESEQSIIRDLKTIGIMPS